jgi:hypothetical protein
LDAIEAENAEHSMTVMEAVRAYPMACFWAFVMSSTIVSHLLSASERPRLTHQFRSWNLTTYFLWAISSPCPRSLIDSVY